MAKNIALFASGSGTNVENIIKYFENNNNVNVSIVLSNSTKAFVLERASNFNIPTFVFSRELLYKSNVVIEVLNNHNIDLVVLAGFMWLVPGSLVNAYPNKIINIHPALLPKYGGKGMYGSHVHNAVVENKESESGMTIHYVNERYDEGNIIFQATCEVLPSDTADDVANKVHTLEYEHFPPTIENVLL